MINELLKSLKRHKSLIVIELFSWCELGPRGMISLAPPSSQPVDQLVDIIFDYIIRFTSVDLMWLSAFEAK